jgi:nucleoside-diphosphate-sugar epimerase
MRIIVQTFAAAGDGGRVGGVAMRRDGALAAGRGASSDLPRWKRYRFGSTPTLTRVVYDGACTVGGAALAYGHGTLFFGRGAGIVFACAALVLPLNWAFGLYTRIQIGATRTKAVRVLTVIVLTALAAIAVSRDSTPTVLLWSVFVGAPLVLPRVLLNFNVHPAKASFLATAVQSRGPVLLVGGAGYIGTHVIAELLAANYRVRVLDRLIYGRRPIHEFLRDPRFELIEGDVTDIVRLVEAMKDASAVVHLAGLVGDPACAVDEAFTRHANVIATRMVKEVALSLGVSRFVFASSCSVYGTTDRSVDEDAELNPVSLYARTKIDSETELLLSPREHFDPVILRFATVFGHSRRPRFDLVANLFTAQAMTDGVITVTGERQWRPFVHVRDLAHAIVLALRADPRKTRGQIFNVGDNRINMTIGQLAELVRDVVARERVVTILKKADLADRRNYAVSFDKIRTALGFEASVSMQDGIEEMVREFKAGTYGDYHAPFYSNLEMTKQAFSEFLDPVRSARLYVPIAEAQVVRRRSNGAGMNVARFEASAVAGRARAAPGPRLLGEGPPLPHST